MKNIFILALLFVFGKTAEANMVLVSFELNGASSDNKFTVSDPQVPTNIEFRFNLMKYSDPSSPGDCYVTLLYTESPEANNYDGHPSTIEISPTKYVRKSEFASNGTIYQSVWLPAVLPAYKSSGKIVLRYRFFHSAQNKEVSWYSTVKYEINSTQPQYAVKINSIPKVETVLIGTDCGFAHAYGTSFNPNGHMENGVWKFAYDINYTTLNSAVADSDIYWEWIVSDYSNYPITEKQFLVYPYEGAKYGPFNGEKKVFVEANDFLDEYDSKVTVRAKSRSTGAVYSQDYVFYFTAVNH